MCNRLFSLPRILLSLSALAVFFACHLTKTEEAEDTFTFPSLKDSLGGADHAVIVLKTESGQVIDTIYNGPVMPSTTFKGLVAPHFVGGKVIIEIQATKGGIVVYQITRSYDGDNDQTLGTVVLVSPSATVKIQWPGFKLREGDSVPLPGVKILPTTLTNPSLGWVSRQPSILLAGSNYLKALVPGSATLVVWLKSDTTKRDSILIEVVSKNTPSKALDSLRLTPDPLTLALRGPAGRFTVNPYPITASKDVTWTSLDPVTVSVSDDGLLTALALGTARILAVSKLEPTALDTARVEVAAPLKVDSLRLEKDSVEVFVQGASDSLKASVYPPLANPAVTFTVRDGAVAQVEGGKVQGLKEGETWVVAKSVEDPTKVDSLKVIVFPSQRVDSVRVSPDSLKLYVKGESKLLAGALYPATLQKRFTWRSAFPAIATVDGAGLVTPVAEGKAYVSAVARADGTKSDSALVIVKKDTPHLQVGGDTTLAVGVSLIHTPTVTQEYGLVVMFKWDLNGDGTYEDSSATVKPNLSFLYGEAKVYGVHFYVRDTEGNDTVVVRKVTAVNGRVVQILTPKDGSSTNQSPITVTWSVDGVQQANSQGLNVGPNTVVRSAQDSAKNTYSATITVTLDQTAPNRPTVKGSWVPVNTLTPAWSWASGQGGGNGSYRYRLDNPDMSASAATTDTFYTAPTNLNSGAHTLYVQERDEAGNWSPSGSFAVRIDTTAPPAPSLSVAPASPTANPRPTWSWTGGVGDAYRYYRYKLGNDDFRSGGKDTTGTAFTPATGFTDGTYTLYVQERDSAGNWSASASVPITIDLVAPMAPTVSVTAALTNDETPTWTWTAETGGNGSFRYKINSADLTTGATTTTLLAYTPTAGLGEGTFTLYVQERDAAGNWSPSGLKAVRVDLTVPSAPRIDSTPYSPLNSLRPKWTWKSGTGGVKVFRARVDTSNLTGAMERSDSSFIPQVDLPEGKHTLYVQERDSAGNWSQSAYREIVAIVARVVGARGTTVAGVALIGLAVDGMDIPYILYHDNTVSSVMNYQGNSWGYVGPSSLLPTRYSGNGLTISKQGIPMVMFNHFDSTSSTVGAGVVSFRNGGWGFDLGAELVGDIYASSIASDNQGKPIVAFLDYRDTTRNMGVSVLRLNGGWEPIGPLRFTNTSLQPKDVQLKLDGAGNPLVSFIDYNTDKVSVMRYVSATNSWEYLGLPNIQNKIVLHHDLALGSTDSVYLAIDGVSPAGYATVLHFAGGVWQNVGVSNFAHFSSKFNLGVGGSNTPYLGYTEYDTGIPKIVAAHGGVWTSLRNSGAVPGLSNGAGSVYIAISTLGVPVLGLDDGELGWKVTVTKCAYEP